MGNIKKFIQNTLRKAAFSLSENKSLSSLGRVYFVGIGGVSMSSLALILKQTGVFVCGYDFKHSENTDLLEQKDIPVYYDTQGEHFASFDTYVYTAAIGFDNPILAYAVQEGKNILTRAELLGLVTREYKYSIGVSGTHGKSSTTGFISHIFDACDCDGTVLAGAKIPSLNSTYRIGKGNLAVFEACEYKNSYHYMNPSVRVVLNCELDHVDFFENLDNVISSFEKYITTNQAEKENFAVINLDCDSCVKAASTAKEKGVDVKYFSLYHPCDLYAQNIDLSDGYGEFDIMTKDVFLCHVKLSVPGLHNISNALAAALACYVCGIDAHSIQKGLSSFGGVKRRFEKKGYLKSGALVVDDYAHHPDEIKATLTAAKLVTKGRIICVFQPHTYSRTKALLDEFAKTLSIADKVVLADIYAARETNTYGVCSMGLCEKIEGSEYFDTFEKIADFVQDFSNKDDLVLTMGAGDIYKVFDGRLFNEQL